MKKSIHFCDLCHAMIGEDKEIHHKDYFAKNISMSIYYNEKVLQPTIEVHLIKVEDTKSRMLTVCEECKLKIIKKAMEE